jgi:hypothetical protein
MPDTTATPAATAPAKPLPKPVAKPAAAVPAKPLTAKSAGEKRRTLERQLTDLRRSRGRALADGKPFDNSRITEVEDHIAALADTETELEGREAIAVQESARQQRAANLTAYKLAVAARVKAVGDLEAPTRAFASAIGAVVKTHAAERVAVHNLGVNPDSEGELMPVNFAVRLWGNIRGVLRGALGTRFGHLDLSPMPGDLDPADSWASAEALRGTLLNHFTREA